MGRSPLLRALAGLLAVLVNCRAALLLLERDQQALRGFDLQAIYVATLNVRSSEQTSRANAPRADGAD